ncbi:MAG: hypothetical protein K2Q10_08955, partial [Rhodospirillales bacterium]|nr:hypothetical protein [Rhodospirillales bacterium]
MDHTTTIATADPLEQLGDALAQKGLERYVADSDLAEFTVEWLEEKTGLPKAAAQLVVKIIAMAAVPAAGRLGAWFGGATWSHLKDGLRRVSGYEHLTGACEKLLGAIDREIAAKAEVRDILAGKRPARTAEQSRHLETGLQVQLQTLVGLDAIASRLNPQPLLSRKVLENAARNRFVFGARHVPFLGRDK